MYKQGTYKYIYIQQTSSVAETYIQQAHIPDLIQNYENKPKMAYSRDAFTRD